MPERAAHLATLIDAAGSAARLAAILGADPRTVQRWHYGEMAPDGVARYALRRAADELGVPHPAIAAPRKSTA